MRLLVTGGAGFIGSNFVHYWLDRHPDDHVVVLDLLTYAGDRRSLADVEDRIVFAEGDIADLELCERVTAELRDLLERYSLEVSSPGSDRPLTKPDHFRRFLGHRVRVRTGEAIDGQRSFTGILVAADERVVSVREATAERSIPLAAIRRTNLVPETDAQAVAL